MPQIEGILEVKIDGHTILKVPRNSYDEYAVLEYAVDLEKRACKIVVRYFKKKGISGAVLGKFSLIGYIGTVIPNMFNAYNVSLMGNQIEITGHGTIVIVDEERGSQKEIPANTITIKRHRSSKDFTQFYNVLQKC
ncbi:hypothetical protein CL1_0308 [Thermococcus cleftensis]|uniref:Uncharacterized protein n=1 Tax=Thermococcus cleftensis (strain DSM 27260 / KACC 17922 / CL1) TaxID=163003 RepID=I3ZS35_THECF|nr:hypothetical protein [Thermococcus cleftensis]AFL94519.1 hypothetical protein CL1_0308 [Thermococcus cleftensis]